ncbi:PREDICTED: G-type lectin S-receptor-like serine/threonine-protein kinase At4g27290 [Populus euphratica]|uniref:Receptor-like serine/threonine-protein kinase n=1 Tax=Populus euphratica TaxID=75702 RepID=A0AAJ6XTZ8_POPEU|nr:PREDICTED: G-type lectin S-receptor-like serine/threonine-protein kinase At4g27290 [Populus euphratica]
MGVPPEHCILVLLFCSSLLLIVETATATDTINTTHSIRDGDTMVSAEGTYVLGFFSPGESKNRYVGIWYGKIPVMTIVWVANRETPLNDSSGVLGLTDLGILVILNQNGTIIWSSNSSRSASNPAAQLLDSGNLVVKEEGDTLENSLWQSFEHPTDTILPGMKLGRNRITGMEWYMTSWKSPDDPSRGNFTCMLIPYGYPELVVMQGSKMKYRSGPWDGLRFSGIPNLKPNPVYKFEFVISEEEIFYRESLVDKSMLWRFTTDQSGNIPSLAWIVQTQSWLLYETANSDNCDRYALCGANGLCNIQSSPVCECLDGFVPKIPTDWAVTVWSSGCVRRTPLNCSGDGFRKLSGVKMPETKASWFDKSLDLEECKSMCLKNCSCTAYSNMDIRGGGSGCLLWFGDLIDNRRISENEQNIYIRMAASELDNGDGAEINADSNVKKIIIISTLSIGIFLLGLVLVLYVWRRKHQKKGIYLHSLNKQNCADETEDTLLDWPTRYNIINGIARGLLYLHQDSRLRVIHRDLKASNILLDYELNPKISDFGLARSFGGNEIEANTIKVAGTYGYISPEYAIEGLYSVKSDVFSFGVLVLEIVSGYKNRGFSHPEHSLNLLGHAWRLFREGRPMELVRQSIIEACNLSQVLRSIHVALLCVQDNREDRPDMSYVVLMLSNDNILPQPKHPGFFIERDPAEASSTGESTAHSANKCSITLLQAR